MHSVTWGKRALHLKQICGCLSHLWTLLKTQNDFKEVRGVRLWIESEVPMTDNLCQAAQLQSDEETRNIKPRCSGFLEFLLLC